MNRKIPPSLLYRFGVYALWFRWGLIAISAVLLVLIPFHLFPYPRLSLLALMVALAIYNFLLHRLLFTREEGWEPFAPPSPAVRYKWVVDLLDGVFGGIALYLTGGAGSPLFPILPIFLLISTLLYPFWSRLGFFLFLCGIVLLLHLISPLPLTAGPQSFPTGNSLLLVQCGFLLVSSIIAGIAHRGITLFLSEIEARRVRIQRMESFLDHLFHILPFGIIVSTPGGEILRANRFAVELFEIGSDFFQNILRLRRVESSGLSSYLEDLFQGNPLDLRDFPISHPTQGKIWLRVVGIPTTPDHPQVILLIFDVTSDVKKREEERAIQQRVMEVEKFTTLGQLAAGVAHELNNPLSTLSGIIQFLRYLKEQDKLTPQTMEEKFEEMERQIARINELIKNLLQYARPHRGAPQPQEFPGLIREVQLLINYTFQKAGIPLLLDLAPDLPPLLGYRSDLEQILINLLLNALDATQSAGVVEPVILRVYRQEAGGGEEAIIEVADRGVGIPPEIRSRIFEPFFTTKGERGMGLGLAIVQAIVERYQGRIEVLDREDGRGTLFRVHLPYLSQLPDFSPILTSPASLSYQDESSLERFHA